MPFVVITSLRKFYLVVVVHKKYRDNTSVILASLWKCLCSRIAMSK